MYLVQILIPVFDNDGNRFARQVFAQVREELTEAFGGVTAFVQSPARGLWKDADSGRTWRDDMILVEVMVTDLDRGWWAAYRETLEKLFRQEEIVIRAIACERL